MDAQKLNALAGNICQRLGTIEAELVNLKAAKAQLLNELRALDKIAKQLKPTTPVKAVEVPAKAAEVPSEPQK